MVRDVKLTFQLNWAMSLAIAIFWIYSISGYPNGSAISNSFLNLCIFCFFAFLVFNFNSDYFQSKFKFSLRLVNLTVFVFFSFFVTWANLKQPLWGDQIYHASFAARHTQLFIYYSEHNAPYLWSLIRDISVKDLVQLINLLILGLVSFIFFVIPKIHFKHPTMLVMLMLFLLEAIRHYVGKNSLMDGIEYPAMLNSFGIIDPHPLFRAFPLVISSAIFGGADIGFRLAGFICFLLFLCFLFFKIKEVADSTASFLATISIGTIPIFWHVSYLVEQSIWAVLGSSLIFIALTTSKNLEKVQLIPLISVVIIATLLRAPAFLCIIPVIIIFVHKFYSGTLTDSSEKKSFATLLMLLTLVVIVSAVRGSPATETENAYGKWLFSLTNNISAIASVSIIGLFPLFFIGFFLKTHDKDRVIIFLAAISFITAALFIYYGPLIKQLWGVGRYQAEIFVPLIVGGVILYCREIAAAKRNNLTIKLPLFFLIIINLFSFVTLDSRTVKYFADAPPPWKVLRLK